MSSIIVETENENQLTVQEYVRYSGVKEQIEKLMDNAKIKQALSEYEKSIRGMSIDVTIKYTIEKRS
jgi:C1A family cysteine protease